MTIDPGVGSGSGWVIWQDKETTNVIDYGLAVASVSVWFNACNIVCQQLKQVMQQHRVRQVIIEYPRFMQSNAGRRTAERGDLIKLAVLTGRICQAATDLCPQVLFYDVSTWKAQWSKEIVKERVLEILGYDACKGFHRDIWDAAGIGLAARGLL
jgi:Holliday junction resolvasome RuvABC endonuclease subunit